MKNRNGMRFDYGRHTYGWFSMWKPFAVIGGLTAVALHMMGVI